MTVLRICWCVEGGGDEHVHLPTMWDSQFGLRIVVDEPAAPAPRAPEPDPDLVPPAQPTGRRFVALAPEALEPAPSATPDTAPAPFALDFGAWGATPDTERCANEWVPGERCKYEKDHSGPCRYVRSEGGKGT